MEFSVSLYKDDSGFLRRECPTCVRQFKWFDGQTEDRPIDFLEPENHYFCPYCGEPASKDSWWTPAQIEYATAVSMGPISRGIERELRSSFFKYETKPHNVPAPLIEPDDMMIIEPPCHPFEPIKVMEDWNEPLHCLMCGSKFRL